VYRVHYWGQYLAVKIFHENEEVRAWRRELNSLTFLTHTNTVRMFYVVYETLQDRNKMRPPVGYAMELMTRSADDVCAFNFDKIHDGRSNANIYSAHATDSVPRSDCFKKIECSVEQLLQLFHQIASVISFSHEHGVVHFDIKPDNILLDDSCSIAKICDFGCAYELQNLSTTVSATVNLEKFRGTILYMAPEAFDGDIKFPTLCDIYSFGKTMWRLLHPHEKLYPQMHCQVTAPVPQALRDLIETCTLANPADRPQSMSEVASHLKDIIDCLRDDEVHNIMICADIHT
jgi:serine/threonine protein kinase